MKLKTILLPKVLSALTLAMESGKVEKGFDATRRCLENDKIKVLFIAKDIQKKNSVFKIPEKEQFTKNEVNALLNRYKSLSKKKKKKEIDLKKELAILKILAKQKKITVLHSFTRQQLGQALGAKFEPSCAGIIDYGRSQSIFENIFEINNG